MQDKRQLTRFSLAVLVGLLCTSRGHAQLSSNQALTVDQTGNSLYVIDDAGSILSTTAAGIRPIDVVITVDGNTGLVAMFNPGELRRFDLTVSPPALTGAVSVPLLAEDVDVACTPTDFALITNAASNNVVSVDITTMTVVQNLILQVGASVSGFKSCRKCENLESS